ncbi:MAG: hypothetical protein Q7S14_00935, partial [bacterium]|nr:hypothetical protein [bacterium]
MKWIFVIGIFLLLGSVLWIGRASANLSSCMLSVSEKYKSYPEQYQAGLLTKKQFETIFLEMRT